MLTLLLLIILHFKYGEHIPINDTHDGELVCHVGDSSFWKLYNWHFGNATSVKISLLLRKHATYVRRYVSNILYPLFSKSKYKRSFTIEANRIIWKRNDSYTAKLPVIEYAHSYNNYFNVSDVYDTDDCDEFEQLQMMRRYSGDPYTAYLLIVFDLEDLNIYLETQHCKIIPNPRGSYIIIILTPYITNIVTELNNVLNVLWEEYGLLNVYIKLTCSNYKKTFWYNPFVYNNDTWGIIGQFDINDALKNPTNYHNNLRNMQGYPVDISMFVRRPTAILNLPKSIKYNINYKILQKSGGYGGVDGTVLAYISDNLNFTTRIKTPSSDREYGFNLNGTLVGSLGDVVYHKVAASFNGRFISQYDSDKIEFTTPISNDYLCLLVPKAEKIPQWLKIAHCFKPETWLGIFSMYIVISMYWSIANRVIISKVNRNIEDSFLEVLTLLMAVPFRRVSFDNQKVFFGVCLIFNVIFTGTFQGSLYNSYTKESYFPDINTLEELDNSGLYIATNSKSLVTAFGTDPKPVMKRMKEKILIFNGTSSLGKAAQERHYSAFERKADAKLRIKIEYTRESDGFEMLHVMDECPWIYYVSYIVPFGSPYLPAFNILINRFLEAGLINKWNLDTVDGLILEKRVRPKAQTNTLKPFTLQDMQAAFYLIIFGLGFSSVVFVVEIFIYWCYKLLKVNKICK